MGRAAMIEQRRIEIEQALEKCMLERGSYDQTSIKDIAQQAGLATGLIHHYFSGKDEILLALAQQHYLMLQNALLSVFLSDEEIWSPKLSGLFSEDYAKMEMMLATSCYSLSALDELRTKCRSELAEALSRYIGEEAARKLLRRLTGFFAVLAADELTEDEKADSERLLREELLLKK